MIAPTNYLQKKADGLLTLTKLEDTFAIDVKKFSIENGLEENPTRHNVTIQEMKDAKTLLQAEIVNLDIMIADCQALDV